MAGRISRWIVAIATITAVFASSPEPNAQRYASRPPPVNPYDIPPDIREGTPEEVAQLASALMVASISRPIGAQGHGLEVEGATVGATAQLADRYHREAIGVAELTMGPRHPGTGMLRAALAQNLVLEDRITEAEVEYRNVLTIFEARLGEDHPETLKCLANLAVILTMQGKPADALPILERVVGLGERRSVRTPPEIATDHANLAATLMMLGRLADAEPHLRRAVEIHERTAPGNPVLALALSNLATNLDMQGKFAEGERVHRQAYAILAVRENTDYLAALELNNLAVNLGDQDRDAAARPLHERALAVFENRLGPNSNMTAIVHRNLAIIDLKERAFDSALQHARAQYSTQEAARARTSASASAQTRESRSVEVTIAGTVLIRSAWSSARQRPADTSALQAEAFAAAQSINISASADALSAGAARVAAERAGAGAAVAEWRAAQERIVELDAQFAAAAADSAASEARAALVAERVTADAALASAEERLGAFPRFFDLLKPATISIADLQATTGDTARLLAPDEALILITAGDDGLPEGHRKGLVFVITKDSTAWAEIPLEPEALRSEIGALHAMLADEGAGATLAPGHPQPQVIYNRTRAFALYRALFGSTEIQAALAGKTRWLVAPQGPLLSLPFAALPMATPTGRDTDPAALRATTWLGLERTLVILPSVSALRVQRLFPLERAQTERTPFFGLGDPAFLGVADDDERRTGQALRPARNYFRGGVADPAEFTLLDRLPHTAEEIRALANNLGAAPDSYVLQLDATEAEIRRRNADLRLERADIIAFATHGLVAGGFQESIAEPALALTPPVLADEAELTSDNDGLLTASEAATLTLSARFVILSACNTASGGEPDADSLSGLARAFFYAGARSLLVSHYPVFDTAAMRLTTEAAQFSREGMRNPEAMRASMRELAIDPAADASGFSFAHPTAWAPFAVIDAN